LLETHIFSEQLLARLELQRQNSGVLFLKGDKGRRGSRQGLEVAQEIVDHAFLLLCAVELLQRNKAASLSQGVNQL